MFLRQIQREPFLIKDRSFHLGGERISPAVQIPSLVLHFRDQAFLSCIVGCCCSCPKQCSFRKILSGVIHRHYGQLGQPLQRRHLLGPLFVRKGTSLDIADPFLRLLFFEDQFTLRFFRRQDVLFRLLRLRKEFVRSFCRNKPCIRRAQIFGKKLYVFDELFFLFQSRLIRRGFEGFLRKREVSGFAVTGGPLFGERLFLKDLLCSLFFCKFPGQSGFNQQFPCTGRCISQCEHSREKGGCPSFCC